MVAGVSGQETNWRNVLSHDFTSTKNPLQLILWQDPKILIPALVSVVSIILTIATIIACIRKSKLVLETSLTLIQFLINYKLTVTYI